MFKLLIFCGNRLSWLLSIKRRFKFGANSNGSPRYFDNNIIV
jgi:hypothetical protein